MKKTYIAPELEATVIDSKDVMTASGGVWVDKATGDNLYSLDGVFSME